MKIKFTRNATPREGGTLETVKGAVIEVDGASAHRWIRRNAAELVEDNPATPTPKPTKKTKGIK